VKVLEKRMLNIMYAHKREEMRGQRKTYEELYKFVLLTENC
jgi:hypothetical protein